MIRSLGSGYCGRGGRGLNIENCRLKNGDSDGRLGTEEGRRVTEDRRPRMGRVLKCV